MWIIHTVLNSGADFSPECNLCAKHFLFSHHQTHWRSRLYQLLGTQLKVLEKNKTLFFFFFFFFQCGGFSSWMLPTCQRLGRHAVCWWLQDSGLSGDYLRWVPGQVTGEPQACGILFGGRREAESGAHAGCHSHCLHLTLWKLYHAGGWELPPTGKEDTWVWHFN